MNVFVRSSALRRFVDGAARLWRHALGQAEAPVAQARLELLRRAVRQAGMPRPTPRPGAGGSAERRRRMMEEATA